MENIYDRIQHRIKEVGTNATKASLEAGLSREFIRQLKYHPERSISGENAKKLATVLETTADWLLYGGPEIENHSNTKNEIAQIKAPRIQDMNKDVPVYGTAAASHNGGAFQLDTGVIDYVRRPRALETAKDIYALYIEGSSMEPQYWPGDLVFVHPHKPARTGDAIILQEYDAQAQEITATVGILLSKNGTHISIKKHNPPAELLIKRSNIRELHKVLSNNELYGI